MKGDIKTLLDFLNLIGHVEINDELGDDSKYQLEYIIKLIPEQSEISVFDLNKLQTVVNPNPVNIWFYNNPDSDQNECQIEIKVLK